MTLYRTFSTAIDEFIERRMEWIMLWPLFIYSVLFIISPHLFAEAPHYQYLNEIASTTTWEIVFLSIGLVRVMSLTSKMFFAWPYYAPLALVSSLGAAFLWGQFTLTFIVGAVVHGTIVGPIAPYSTLVLIECLNIGHAAKGVGQLIKKGV